VGPLVVWTHHATDVLPVFVHDVGAGRTLTQFEISRPQRAPLGVALLGREILLNLRDELAAYDLAGSRTRVLRAIEHGRFFGSDVALSPDQSLIALGEIRPDCRGCLVVIEAATGREVLDLPPEAVPIGGMMSPVVWHTDSEAIVVRGVPNGHRSFGVAMVSVSGEVISSVPELGSVDPTGHYYAAFGDEYLPWAGDQIGCEIWRSISIRDLASGRAIATDDDHRTSLTFEDSRWAPDGKAFLYATRPAPQETDTPCSRAYEEWRAVEPTWWLLGVDGSRVEVEDPATVLDGWARESRVAFECGGGRLPAIEGPDGTYLPPFCADDAGNQTTAALIVDGSQVGRIGSGLVLGVIDLP
jgi:hypothetical protein